MPHPVPVVIPFPESIAGHLSAGPRVGWPPLNPGKPPGHSSPAGLDTTGVQRVDVSSFQALPPPYRPSQVELTTAQQLRQFDQQVIVDRLSLKHGPLPPDCPGAVQYTAVLHFRGRPAATLYATGCDDTPTANFTGNVSAFVDYLQSLLGGG